MGAHLSGRKQRGSLAGMSILLAEIKNSANGIRWLILVIDSK
jgi:hypothetical protein